MSGQVRGGESGKNDLQSFYSLSLYAQGRRRTLLFKTALFRCSVVIFFLKKKKKKKMKCNWEEPKNRL